jgi:penicillin-binding protein 1C
LDGGGEMKVNLRRPRLAALVGLVAVVAMVAVVAVGTIISVVSWQAKPYNFLLPTANQSPSSNAYLTDRQGRLLQTIRLNDKERRLEWVPLNKISPALINAVLAAEDKRFFSHSGVDVRAVTAAIGQNLNSVAQGSTARRGASTISMQLAGGLIADDASLGRVDKGRRSIFLKLQQMRAAWQLEATASKNEILEAYLNTIYFRGEQRGIEAASQAFFSKNAIGLNTNESVVLASLIAAPQAKAALVAKRACWLYDRMFLKAYSAGHESIKQCEPFTMPISRLNKPYLQRADNLVPHVAQRLKTSGALAHGKTLQTSIDYATQTHAQHALSEQLRELVNKGVEDGAVVVLDNRTGEVLAYVGSSGEFSQASQVDAAASLRQAGSTLKPFLYAMAIEKMILHLRFALPTRNMYHVITATITKAG